MVHQSQSYGKDKGKQNKNNNKSKQNTTFKKKKNKEDEGCFMCGSSDHWTKKYPNLIERKYQPEQKTANMMTSVVDETTWYDNLPFVLTVFPSTTWCLDSSENFYVCFDDSLFSSYQVARDSFVMMENSSQDSVHGVGTVDMKLTSGNIIQLKNMQHV
jgi:hypothetical protein